MQLDADHREGLRAVAEDEPHKVSDMFLADLEKAGLIERIGADVELTDKGTKIHESIMASGDGPEKLKDMFNM